MSGRWWPRRRFARRWPVPGGMFWRSRTPRASALTRPAAGGEPACDDRGGRRGRGVAGTGRGAASEPQGGRRAPRKSAPYEEKESHRWQAGADAAALICGAAGDGDRRSRERHLRGLGAGAGGRGDAGSGRAGPRAGRWRTSVRQARRLAGSRSPAAGAAGSRRPQGQDRADGRAVGRGGSGQAWQPTRRLEPAQVGARDAGGCARGRRFAGRAGAALAADHHRQVGHGQRRLRLGRPLSPSLGHRAAVRGA